MNDVKIFFTGGIDNSLELRLNDRDAMTLREWIINETPTLTLPIENGKNETIILFRAHIACMKFN